jgi:hypothetical protein
MNISPVWRILVVALVAMAALVTLVVQEGRARAAGVEALFAMEAIDPRSLLSGHYVIVNLQRTLPAGAPCASAAPSKAGEEAIPYDHEGWLAIAPDPAQARILGLGRTREDAAAFGGLTVRGSYRCSENMPGDFNTGPLESIDLGVDRFHINQREAERIEQILRQQGGVETTRAFAIVSIGKDGRARLKGLQIDGKRLELKWD